jgi:hypothetical protein
VKTLKLARMSQSQTAIPTLIDSWLAQRLANDCATWLRETCDKIAAGHDEKKNLFIAFGLVSRRSGRADIQLNAAELAEANRLRPGWNPSTWSVDQLARTRLLLAVPTVFENQTNEKKWLALVDALFAAAGLEELVALYQALPLLPFPTALKPRIAEGIRSNMKAVFNAVALNNPLASEQLDNDAWNQMILKALFVGSPVAHIVGHAQRANSVLSQMLIDYARERIAAKRPIPPDLWAAAHAGGDPEQRRTLDTLHASAKELGL